MDTPWTAPARSDGAPPASPADVHHQLVIAALLALVLGCVGMATITGCGGVAVALVPAAVHEGDPPPYVMGLIGMAEAVMFLTFSVPYALAVWGLARRRRWGHTLALACFVLFTLSGCCLPVGVYGLWALLRPEGRARFEGAA